MFVLQDAQDMELSLRDWQPGHGGASSQPPNRSAMFANHLVQRLSHQVDCPMCAPTHHKGLAGLS